jgi:hypothetical protein
MNHRQRKTYSGTAIFGLLFFAFQITSAVAQNYTLNSLYSENQRLPQLPAFAPSINNLGQVAYQRKVFDPVQSRFENVIMIHDGTSESVFFNFTDAFGSGTPLNVVINDNGAVAALVAGGGGVCPTNILSCLIRINADQSVTVLATDGAFGGGTADFASFETDIISMNNLGQVAVKVVYNNGTRAIVRIDDSGITEIAQQTATLVNFTTASINNSGVVAFKALDLAGGCSPSGICVFSGTGGPLTTEGVDPGGGGIGFPPFINNNGLVLAPGLNGPLIYTAQGGVVNTLVVGNEDPVFSSLSGQPSQNDLGQFVFVSGFCCPTDFGMFTGNDPSQDTVFRSNQTVFGGTPGDFRTALHYINNSGQIAFALLVVDGSGTPTAHIVRADPIPSDTDGDGIADAQDNCPAVSNSNQLDSDGDGVGNACDPNSFAPVANNDNYSTNQNTLLTVLQPGVLSNDTDNDPNTTLTAQVVSNPSHAASFTLNSNGSFSYTPATNYSGPDSFTYRANDGEKNSNVATVTITVNAVPPDTGFCSILGNDPKPSVLDQDIYKLRGIKGEQVRIRLETAGNNNTGNKASLALVGIGLLKTDNSTLPNEVSAVLPTTGEYLVIVAEQPLILSSSRFRGNYCVSVQSSGNAAQTFQPKEWVE